MMCTVLAFNTLEDDSPNAVLLRLQSLQQWMEGHPLVCFAELVLRPCEVCQGNSGDASMSLRSAFFEMGKHAGAVPNSCKKARLRDVFLTSLRSTLCHVPGLVEAIRHYSAVAVGVGVELAIVSTGHSTWTSPDGAAAFAQSQARHAHTLTRTATRAEAHTYVET
eukprot:3321655-Amphidinium_carterae.1